jgi:hypothetical protein
MMPIAADKERALAEILQFKIPMEDWTILEEEIERAHSADFEDQHWLSLAEQ